MQASICVLQVLPAEPTKLLEGLFIFSLIWSIGATTETAGRTLFNHFLRKLLRKGVEESPDRTEFDLGPGVTIATPESDLRAILPVVSASLGPGVIIATPKLDLRPVLPVVSGSLGPGLTIETPEFDLRPVLPVVCGSLGPGVTIETPEFDLRPVLPVVSAKPSPAASRTVVPAC